MKNIALATAALLAVFILVPMSYAAPACCTPGQSPVPAQPLLNGPQATIPGSQAPVQVRGFMPQAFNPAMVSAPGGMPVQGGAGCCGGQRPSCCAPAVPSCCAPAGPACGCSGARGAVPPASAGPPQAPIGPKSSAAVPDCCAPKGKPAAVKGPGRVKSDALLISTVPLNMGNLVPATSEKLDSPGPRVIPASAFTGPTAPGYVTLW